jgi:hypothetical protein
MSNFASPHPLHRAQPAKLLPSCGDLVEIARLGSHQYFTFQSAFAVVFL